jgi:hypothetical protein
MVGFEVMDASPTAPMSRRATVYTIIRVQGIIAVKTAGPNAKAI